MLKVRLLYVNAFPQEALLSVAFMLGIFLAELGAVGISSRSAIFEAAGRRKDLFNKNLAWVTICYVNLFEAFAITVSSSMVLNNTVGIREAFQVLMNALGVGMSYELAGTLLSIVIGFTLPAIALSYYKVSSGISSAEQYLSYKGLLDNHGKLVNPELTQKSSKNVKKEVSEVSSSEGFQGESQGARGVRIGSKSK